MNHRKNRSVAASLRGRRRSWAVILLFALLWTGYGCARIGCARIGSLTRCTDYFAYRRMDATITVRGVLRRVREDGYTPRLDGAEGLCPGVSSTGQERPFSAEIRVQFPKTASETGDSGGATPWVTVTYTAPDALAGMTVTRKDGNLSLCLDSLPAPQISGTQNDAIGATAGAGSEAFASLLRCADILLLPDVDALIPTRTQTAEAGWTDVWIETKSGRGCFGFREASSRGEIPLPVQVEWVTEDWQMRMTVDVHPTRTPADD